MTSVHRHDDVRIYHKEAKSLRARGFDVTILCSDYEGEDSAGIRFVRVSLPKGRMRRILSASRRFSRVAKEMKTDYVHFHDPELIPAGVRLRHFAKVVYDVHEDVPRQILTKPYLRPWIAKLCSRVVEWYERRSSKKLFGVVAAEPVIYDRFAPLNPNTVLVCNYPILGEFEKTARDFFHRKNKVCYLGGITEIRGIFEMLAAVEGTDVKLELAGDFETEELRRRVEAHPGYTNAEYLGFLGRQEVRKMLSEVRAGLVTLHPIPKYLTALPVKMFEYMIAEVPVISSNFPYWSEIVEDASCGICVDPMNPQEIRAAIEYILKNPDVAREMGQNGRRKVLEKYNWEIEKEKLFALYCGKEETV